MLNDDASNLKAHLKTLHANLAQTEQVDEELQELLRQLDGDIKTLLERRAEAGAGATRAGTYGLAERTQEITAQVCGRASDAGAGAARAGQDVAEHGDLSRQSRAGLSGTCIHDQFRLVATAATSVALPTFVARRSVTSY